VKRRCITLSWRATKAWLSYFYPAERLPISQTHCLVYGLLSLPQVLPYFTLKGQMASVLTSKLYSKARVEQDYVFRFFVYHLGDLLVAPSAYFIDYVKTALQKGDNRFYTAFGPPFFDSPAPFYEAIALALKKELDEFKDGESVSEPPSDDDVPF
jgi:hypothetical protein